MSMGTNAAESPSNNRSPRGGGGDGGNSPQSRRTGGSTAVAVRNLYSPWANVVRGGGSVEREAVASTASTAAAAAAAASASAPPWISLPSVAEAPPPDPALESDCSHAKALPPGDAVAEAVSERPDYACDGSGNAAKAAKKPAWNKPSNGVVLEAGPVMGAAWPALSESARVSAKSSDSSRVPSDGSTPVSASMVPATASPLPSPTTNNSTPNHVFLARHKSSKRGGGGGMGPTNNGELVPVPAETLLGAPDKPAAAAETPPDSSPRDPPNKNNNWEAGPRVPVIRQSHGGTDLSRGPFRRGNSGPRGDGSYHGGYGNRRDHERTNYEWNQPQGFNGRDVHVRQPRAMPRNFIRPPAPAPGSYVTPPIRPYGGPMSFPELPAPQYYIPVPPPQSVRGGPFVAHPGPPPPMFYPPPAAAQLQTMLIKQIEYYFSAENLCKDLFLRRHMDELGWVPVSLIANFNRVKQLTNNIHFILDTLRMSAVVEVQGDKIRSRSEWKSWILQPSNQSPPSAGSQSPGTSHMVATAMQNVELEDQTGKRNQMNGPVTATSSSEAIGKTINQTTDQPVSSRNLGRANLS